MEAIIIDGLYKHPKFGTGHVRQIFRSGMVVFDRDINGEKENVNPNDLFLVYDPNAVKSRVEKSLITMNEQRRLEFPVGQIVYTGCDHNQAVVIGYKELDVIILYTSESNFCGKQSVVSFQYVVK